MDHIVPIYCLWLRPIWGSSCSIWWTINLVTALVSERQAWMDTSCTQWPTISGYIRTEWTQFLDFSAPWTVSYFLRSIMTDLSLTKRSRRAKEAEIIYVKCFKCLFLSGLIRKWETLKHLGDNVSWMTNDWSEALVRLGVYRCVFVCGTWPWTGSLINLSVRVRKVDDIPCSSKTCVCTWFFSSSPPPTAVFALSKQANERMLYYKCCRFKTSSALWTVTSVACCQLPHKKRHCILQSSKHCGYSNRLTMCMKQTNALG